MSRRLNERSRTPRMAYRLALGSDSTDDADRVLQILAGIGEQREQQQHHHQHHQADTLGRQHHDRTA